MPFERLSGDYVRGYTKAIQDTISVFEYVNEELTCKRKRMNYKIALELLNAILRERANVRDDIDGFIRMKQGEGFEFYNKKLG